MQQYEEAIVEFPRRIISAKLEMHYFYRTSHLLKVAISLLGSLK